MKTCTGNFAKRQVNQRLRCFGFFTNVNSHHAEFLYSDSFPTLALAEQHRQDAECEEVANYGNGARITMFEGRIRETDNGPMFVEFKHL